MTRLLALLLLCLAVGISASLLAVRPTDDVELVDYFPEDTLVFIEWEQAAGLGERWRLDQVGKTVPPSTWFQFLEQAGGSDALIGEARRAVLAWETYVNHPAVASLLGSSAAFALLPEPAGQADFFPSRQWVVAVRVDADASEHRFEEWFGRIRSRRTIGYQGERLLHLVADDGQEVFCWQHRNVVLLAGEQSLIRRCIDQNLRRMVRTRTGLFLNTAYQRLRRLNKSRADIFCYIDLERLRQRLPLVRAIESASGGRLPRQLAFCHRAVAGASQWGIGALVGRESTRAFAARHQLAPPVRQPLPGPMVRETELALWTNWFKPKYLWDFVRQQAGDEVASLMAAVGQQLSEAAGTSLDDFFDVFGGEFGVMMIEQPIEHQSPRSLGCLLVAVRDRPAVAAMIERLVAGLQVITVESGNLEIASVMLAGGLLQPAYALLDHHLILADSVELVELARRQLLHDGPGGGRSGRRGDEGGQGNVAVFVRVGEMAERLAPLLTLLAKETGERNRVLSHEGRRFVREIGLPLLTALRTVSTGRLQGYVADDTLFMELEYTPQRD